MVLRFIAAGRLSGRFRRSGSLCAASRGDGGGEPVARVLTDSRNCSFGEEPLFVAMKGTNHDSHAFIGEMVRRDVKAFLAERKTQLPAGCGYVVVPSAIAALQQLAAHHRARFKGRVVGITGSNGKTVVKEWIAQQIPAGVKYFRSPKSYNSQLGVALSLLMIEGEIGRAHV